MFQCLVSLSDQVAAGSRPLHFDYRSEPFCAKKDALALYNAVVRKRIVSGCSRALSARLRGG